MDTAQNPYRTPQMRASDADRDAVVAALSEHFQAGRLTTEELEERTGQALAARTTGELDALTADLPGLLHAGPVPAAPAQGFRHVPLVPVAVLLAAVVVATLALVTGQAHHGWDGWLAVPVGLLIARRVIAARTGGRGSRRAPW